MTLSGLFSVWRTKAVVKFRSLSWCLACLEKTIRIFLFYTLLFPP